MQEPKANQDEENFRKSLLGTRATASSCIRPAGLRGPGGLGTLTGQAWPLYWGVEGLWWGAALHPVPRASWQLSPGPLPPFPPMPPLPLLLQQLPKPRAQFRQRNQHGSQPNPARPAEWSPEHATHYERAGWARRWPASGPSQCPVTPEIMRPILASADVQELLLPYLSSGESLSQTSEEIRTCWPLPSSCRPWEC